MDIVNYYSAYATAGSAAASQAGTNTARGTSGDTFAEMARQMAANRVDDAAEAERKAELVRQLADADSAFYADMRVRLRAQLERSKEDQQEQALIDALGKILDALSGKEDENGRKTSLNKSSAELTRTIGDRMGELDPDDPERVRLEQMLKRLREMGIYIDLDDMDDMWEGGDETFETLTQLLTRRQAEEINSAVQSDRKEVNEPV